MLDGSDQKQDMPCCSDEETSTVEDDARSHQRRRFRYRKIILHHKMIPFRFMNLPREIRNIIYEMTLTEPNGKFRISVAESSNLCRSRAVIKKKRSSVQHPYLSQQSNLPAAPTRNIALLRTSKTIHAEAGAILYGQKLVFDNLVALQSFLVGLRPSQISLLRHVHCAHDYSRLFHPENPSSFGRMSAPKAWTNYRPPNPSRPLMPSVFALLAGADNLETLNPDIRAIDPTVFSSPRYRALTANDISVAEWDAVVAREMAAEAYRHLFTYFRRAVAVRGIDEVMGVLDIFYPIFWRGPDFMEIQEQPKHVTGVEWTQKREDAMCEAMGKEIERLLEQDNV